MDATIVVRKNDLGTDNVTVSLDEKYPPEVLKQQAEALAKNLGSDLRGYRTEIFRPNSNDPGGYLRATFAVAGLIDRSKSTLGLQAMAQAFTGAPSPHTLHTLMVQYETEAPSRETLKQWRDPEGSVLVQADASPQTGIEYRIKLNTQDASKIRIPEGAAAQAEKTAPTEKKVPPSRSDWWIWPVILLAAASIGALVYSLLLRPRPRGPR
jgi:hypothetical protein